MRLLIVVGVGLFLLGCDEPGAKDRAAAEMKLNESLAVSHLRALAGAEVHAKSLCVLDADGDGDGEYAFISELSGGASLRGPGEGLKLPLLAGEFQAAEGSEAVAVHGYRYRVFLPGAGEEVVGEGRDAPSMVSSDGAETKWACYAWPDEYGATGKRTFFVNQKGEVRGIDDSGFTGDHGPEARAALTGGAGLEGEAKADWREVE